MYRLLTLLLAFASTFGAPVVEAADRRPNILFILVDDQSPSISRSIIRTRSWMHRTSNAWPARG